MKRLFLTALLGLSVASFVPAKPAQACMADVKREVFYADFDRGATTLSPSVQRSFASYWGRVFAQVSNPADKRYVDGYQIIASGDIGEGAEWDAAGPAARAADQALGTARGETLRAALIAEKVTAKRITVTIRDNRQVFTPQMTAQNPALTPTLGGAIVSSIWPAPVPSARNEPVPVC